MGGIIAGVAVAVTADGGFGSSPARVIARSRLFRLSTEVSCTCCCIAGADALVVGGCGRGGDIVPDSDSDPAEADAPPPPPSSTSNSAHSHEILYFELIVYNAVATSFVEEDGGGGD